MNNNTTTEDYCSFEVSKLLKEKGFDVPCRGHIHCSHYHLVKNNVISDRIPTSVNEMFAPVKNWNGLTEPSPNKNGDTLTGLNTSIPSHALAIKWIRENFKYNIYTYTNGKIWYPCIQHLFGDMAVLSGKIGIFDSPEQATEAALKYTLNHLI